MYSPKAITWNISKTCELGKASLLFATRKKMDIDFIINMYSGFSEFNINM